MDAIVVLALLVMLALVAPRWGRVSSDQLRPKEQEFAAFGLSWRDLR